MNETIISGAAIPTSAKIQPNEVPVTITPSTRPVFAPPHLSRSKPGFIDRLIHGPAQAQEQTLVTFEKAAKKLAETLV